MASFNDPSEIRAAVIGYGGAFNMGKAHLSLVVEAGMTPGAVAEIDPDRLRSAKEDYPGIATFGSVNAMLEAEAADLVILITPHNTHAPLAIQCLESGCHVVSEKPLAITTEEVDQMMMTAQKTGLMLSTYHNRHWDGNIIEAKKRILQNREIGEIVRIDAHMTEYSQPKDWWRSSRPISGGILYDWGVHLLEYSLQLIDSEIREVCGFAFDGYWGPKTKWKEEANEDEAFAVVRFSDSKWLTLRISHLDPCPRPGILTITGTEGTYIMDHHQSTVIRKENDEKTETTFPNPPCTYLEYYRNIADHLCGKAELIITPEWSRRPIHILDLARQSAEQNQTLRSRYA